MVDYFHQCRTLNRKLLAEQAVDFGQLDLFHLVLPYRVSWLAHYRQYAT